MLHSLQLYTWCHNADHIGGDDGYMYLAALRTADGRVVRVLGCRCGARLRVYRSDDKSVGL